MPDRPTVWLDLVSPSHPLFFEGLFSTLSEVDLRTTVRDKTETVDLADQAGFEFDVLGRDFDTVALRTAGVPLRTIQLALQAPRADVSVSASNAMCVLASRARGLPTIHFTDNDITAYVDTPVISRLFCRFRALATHHIVPAAFQLTELTRWGVSPDRIHTYDGYKEDIYVAGFEPDQAVLTSLPFDSYVALRPEALGAAYVDEEETIVPALLDALVDRGMNVVYLPRRPRDRRHTVDYPTDQVHVPESPINGLQLAWFSDGVLTGSGTMGREAACLAKPAVSFFPGPLLSVDRQLVDEGRMFHSRDPEQIATFLEMAPSTTGSLNRSKHVRDQAVSIVRQLLRGGSFDRPTAATVAHSGM